MLIESRKENVYLFSGLLNALCVVDVKARISEMKTTCEIAGCA